MEKKDSVIIRTCRPEDREGLRKICCDTAFFGNPCEHFFPDRQLLADLIMNYYIDHEPENTFVAEAGGEVVGYLCAGFDEKLYQRKMLVQIIPKSIVKALRRGLIWDRRTLKMILYNIQSGIRGEAVLKADSAGEWAHIHQNIRHDYRGAGIGGMMVRALLEYAGSRGITGIKFRCLRQEDRFGFFEKYGFQRQAVRRVRVWERWLGREPLYYMEYRFKLNEGLDGC